MRNVFLSTIVIISVCSFGQTKEETQILIKESVERYGLSNEDLFHDYIIEFDNDNLIVNESFGFYNFLSIDKMKVWIPIGELSEVYFEEYPAALWLHLKLKNGNNKIKKLNNDGSLNYGSDFLFILSKSFTLSSNYKKMISAFNRLTNTYNRKVKSTQIQNKSIATKLDEKNGFKEFKIGDDLKKWQQYLTYTNTADGGVKYYDYTGDCCSKLFSYSLKNIRVGFKDDKIEVIYLATAEDVVYTSGWVSTEYIGIKTNFINLFGIDPPDIPSNDNSGKVITLWTGENISLILSYEYAGVKQIGGEAKTTGRCTIMIYKNTSIEDGF